MHAVWFVAVIKAPRTCTPPLNRCAGDLSAPCVSLPPVCVCPTPHQAASTAFELRAGEFLSTFLSPLSRRFVSRRPPPFAWRASSHHKPTSQLRVPSNVGCRETYACAGLGRCWRLRCRRWAGWWLAGSRASFAATSGTNPSPTWRARCKSRRGEEVGSRRSWMENMRDDRGVDEW